KQADKSRKTIHVLKILIDHRAIHMRQMLLYLRRSIELQNIIKMCCNGAKVALVWVIKNPPTNLKYFQLFLKYLEITEIFVFWNISAVFIKDTGFKFGS